jgi:hypothetical protein
MKELFSNMSKIKAEDILVVFCDMQPHRLVSYRLLKEATADYSETSVTIY